MIICSNEEEEKSYFISKLHVYKRPFVPQPLVEEFKHFLINHFTKKIQKAEQPSHDSMASIVDCSKYVYLA